jgi:hypothetical protein
MTDSISYEEWQDALREAEEATQAERRTRRSTARGNGQRIDGQPVARAGDQTKVPENGALVLPPAADRGPVTTALRAAIQAAGGWPAVANQVTGVSRTSLYVFMAGRGGLSLTAVDRLAEHFGMRLVPATAQDPASLDGADVNVSQ